MGNSASTDQSELQNLYSEYNRQEKQDTVYEEIAEDWALKRKRPWKELDKEIEKVLDRKNRICIDAGSGSGRNTDIFLKYAQTIIAIDISRKQIEELNNNIFENCAKSSKNKKEKLSDANPKTSFNLDDENSNEMEGLNFSLRVNGIVGDIMHMPIREHSVDFVASISTIHHIQGQSNRVSAIRELLKMVVPSGLLLLTVWRFDIKRFKAWFDWHTNLFSSQNLSRIANRSEIALTNKSFQIKNQSIEFGDVIVPWTVSKLNKTFYRFYHLFTEDSLKQELANIKSCSEIKITKFPEEKPDNLFVTMQIK